MRKVDCKPRICEWCGKEYGFNKTEHPCRFIKRRFCSPRCVSRYGVSIRDITKEKNPNWRGGKIKGSKGYPRIYKNGLFFEHRIIMENYLGRKLLPREIVHHIDGNVKNNKIENLMLFPSNGEHLKYHAEMKMWGLRRKNNAP